MIQFTTSSRSSIQPNRSHAGRLPGGRPPRLPGAPSTRQGFGSSGRGCVMNGTYLRRRRFCRRRDEGRMAQSGMTFRRTYRAAAVAFADLVSRLPDADRPGLGEWSLRELVGHTVSSALRQVPAVLTAPAELVAVESPEGYWALARSAPTDQIAAARKASTADARATAADLAAANPAAGEAARTDPAAAEPAAAEPAAAEPADQVVMVSELVGRATAALAAVGDDDVVATPVGGMRVRDWLPTRTFELVVHGMDVAEAAGVRYDAPEAAVAEATILAARVAAAVGDGPLVLRALTGRTPLPDGYSVL